jgi:aminopeptidase N
LISVGPAQCVDGATVATLTQSQFSADRKQETTANPLSWHVPVKARAGGSAAQVVTEGRATRLSVPGCGTLLVNAGQTGYYRTLYTPQQAGALADALPSLPAVDQYGLLADSMALSKTGYQPMAIGLDFLSAMPPSGSAKVVQQAVRSWDRLYDQLEGNEAAQNAIAARVLRDFGPRLAQLGLAPKDGEPATDAVLRPTLIYTLGKYRDRAVLAESGRLFSAWKTKPDAIPGSLKTTWLSVIARNADTAAWDAIHAKARASTSTVERTALYQLLGDVHDEALARRTLELALTDEPGKTVSAGMITSVAEEHPKLALDFVLAHLEQVNRLIDISGRSRFVQRLVAASHDPAFIPVLESYAKANLAETDRKPIQQSIDRIRYESSQIGRIQSETAEWLKAHGGSAGGERG